MKHDCIIVHSLHCSSLSLALTIVNQEYKTLLPVGPSKSTSISVKHNETTNTNTFLQDIPFYLYEGISTIVHLLLSLPISLRNVILQLSLLTSLQSKFLQSSLLVSLRNGILRSFLLMSLPSLFVSLRNGVLQ